jgi:uncharacterized membrane protein
VAGISDEDLRQGPHDGGAAQPSDPHAADGIRSLHERFDDLERLVAQRVQTEGKREAGWLHEHADVRHQLPAWRRKTKGETRWTVAIVTAIGIALQIMVPGRLVLVRPIWVLPALQGALLIALIVANPRRIDRQSKVLRMLSLLLAALLSLANGWSVGLLVVDIVHGKLGGTAGPLLITGAAIWLTNVIAFALWYWEFDRGGPVARALGTQQYPDFQYPQMVSPQMAPPDWEPTFSDYLYLAFTNASAFSPTDVMPLSRWAKMAMTVQSVISIITVALVVARAVNILPS